jgi:ABC-type transport system involved in cytochrome bd biosynthesis fused ATPase/permease subunit
MICSARTFMRINNRMTRLVVADEATSSLDPVAERDILREFRNVRAGKTIVLVTHRFHHLAHEADRILYVSLSFLSHVCAFSWRNVFVDPPRTLSLILSRSIGV